MSEGAHIDSFPSGKYVTVAKNQGSVMDLGGNMPGDLESRLALARGGSTKDNPLAIDSGNYNDDNGLTTATSGPLLVRSLSGKRRRSSARRRSSVAARQRVRSRLATK